jgi:hypothetical protein
MKPQARRRGLLLRELPDELLVYDQERHRAHCLNRTAALVFRHADGSRTVDELALLLDGGDVREIVVQALAQLDEAGLLAAPVEEQLPPAGIDRRHAVRRMGIAATILLPAVVSIVAPMPAEAAATCVASCAGQPIDTPCDHCGDGTQCSTTIFRCDGAGNCSDGCL